MAKHQRFYSPTYLDSVLKPVTTDNGSPSFDEQGKRIRALDLGAIYNKHLANNSFGGNHIRDGRSVLQDAGSQIHEFAENTLRFLDKRYYSMNSYTLDMTLSEGMTKSSQLLRNHVARFYEPKAGMLLRHIADQEYRDPINPSKTANQVNSPEDRIRFASEQDLFATLDEEKGIGVHGHIDAAYYNPKTNTVTVYDLKTTQGRLGSTEQISEKYGSSFQTEAYPVLVKQNGLKLFGAELSDDVKIDLIYAVVPMNEQDAHKGFGTSKTFTFDKEGIERSKAYLLSNISQVETEKYKSMRAEQLGGSPYVHELISSSVGDTRCKPGACAACPMKLFCPNRSYQELVYEINTTVDSSAKHNSGSGAQMDRNAALAKDLTPSAEYDSISKDITAAKNRAVIKNHTGGQTDSPVLPQLQKQISDEYDAYLNIAAPNVAPGLADSLIPDKFNRAYADAMSSQEGLPVSVLDDSLHPRWLNQKYGQQFAEHLETFARSVSEDVASRFSISPKALTDTVMQRVFGSKKLATELDDIVTQTVKDHFKLQSKIARVSSDDVHRVIDNIGGYLKDSRLVQTVGEHVQMSTIGMINELASDKITNYMKENGIYSKSGQSQAEALRWYISNTGNYGEQVQNTFEKIHRSPSFRGVLSKFSLSDKRFPLPMLAASMFLSYAGALTMAQTQANLAINKGEDYRRYQNDQIPEAGHSGMLSMAYRLVSSAFGSGFQKLRTTYQDTANKALMNNRLFRMFKDATSEAVAKFQNSKLDGKIVRKFFEAPNSVKLFAAAGFIGAMALPIIATKREIGKREEARAKRLRKAKYGKTKSKGDSTSYQKSSDLRYGYKAHTGFGSPFNIGVFESLFVGLRRIASEELPAVLEKAHSLEGKIEEFFVKKTKNAVSSVRKSARALTVESINDNHVNSVLTKQYENMNTLRTGEERALEVAQVQRESDFHTFGVQRTNVSMDRISNQLQSFKVQENLAPDRMTETLEKKAITAAHEDALVKDAVVRVRSDKSPTIPRSTTARTPKAQTSGLSNTSRSDKPFVEQKQLKHESSQAYHPLSNKHERGKPTTNMRVVKPKRETGAIIPSVSHKQHPLHPVSFVNMMKENYYAATGTLGALKQKASTIKAEDVERFMQGNIARGSVAFLAGDLPSLWRNRKEVARSVGHNARAVADIHAAIGVVPKSGFTEYRSATRAERRISRKASADENRKRFRRQPQFF